MTVVGKLVRLSWPERGLLAAAVLCLGAARFLVLVLPFRSYVRIVGTPRRESPAEDPEGREGRLGTVTWAITAAAARLPWRCMCLEQAVAASLILRCQGIPHTLYLGTARGESGLEAHAWLRAGRRVLTGARGRERFVAVAAFSRGGTGERGKEDASVKDLADRFRKAPGDSGSPISSIREGR